MRAKKSDADSNRAPSAPPFPWEMIYLFARIFYDMRVRCEEALKPHAVTTMQFTIMATLERWNGLSSAELSRRFNVTPQTMGEMIGNLERRLLVERRQDPANRRALRLSLTTNGKRLVKLCNAAMDKVETQMLKGLSKREVEELRERMLSLADHLGIGREGE
jgi:DNA-binding MarR family transcriptional regulator